MVASRAIMRVVGLDNAASRRRSIAALATFAAADFALGSLVQTGVIRRLPDLPIRGVDSHRVMTSPAAYPWGIPDAPLALASSGLVIAAAGAAQRARTTRRRRRIEQLLAALSIGGSLGVVHYLVEMIRLRRACAYCIAAAAAMLVIVPLAIGNIQQERFERCRS